MTEIEKAKATVLQNALGICALGELELYQRLEKIYWLGFKASYDREQHVLYATGQELHGLWLHDRGEMIKAIEEVSTARQEHEEFKRQVEDMVSKITGLAHEGDVLSGLSATIDNLAGKTISELQEEVDDLCEDTAQAEAACARLHNLINSPIVDTFMKAVPLEAAHQNLRWGTEHDAGKNSLDWFWTLGYLSQRIVENVKHGNIDKALHHCITSAAMLLNWHRHLQNDPICTMRPGIETPSDA